jgi:hypothetical protein
MQFTATLILFTVDFSYGQPTNPLELIKQPAPTANERIAYGKDPLQFGEMRVPEGTGPFPVAILIHGGCWSTKVAKLPEPVTSFELLRPIASALAKAGVASWNVEYRRLGNDGGGWPGSYLDLASNRPSARVGATSPSGPQPGYRHGSFIGRALGLVAQRQRQAAQEQPTAFGCAASPEGRHRH